MADGSGPGHASEEARAAMGRVAEAMNAGEPVEDVEGFETLPEPVQETLRNLSPDERQVVRRTLGTLADNGFDVELPTSGKVGFL